VKSALGPDRSQRRRSTAPDLPCAIRAPVGSRKRACVIWRCGSRLQVTEHAPRGRMPRRCRRPVGSACPRRSEGTADRPLIRACKRSGAGVEPTHRRTTPVWPILKTSKKGSLQVVFDWCASRCASASRWLTQCAVVDAAGPIASATDTETGAAGLEPRDLRRDRPRRRKRRLTTDDARSRFPQQIAPPRAGECPQRADASPRTFWACFGHGRPP
jgi:hypothetical protein